MNLNPTELPKSILETLNACLLNHSFTFVGYDQAERDCQVLVAKILKIYSRSDLDSMTFIPIPRGGLIVLGMVSYLLDLKPQQLDRAHQDKGPTVIVDDCSYSGMRFLQYRKSIVSEEIIFATLYSHPDLRRAIVRTDPSVKACISAHDLMSTKQSMPDDVDEHRNNPSAIDLRESVERVWMGNTNCIVFSWSEPDHPIRVPSIRRWIRGWRFAPPDRCLKNRRFLQIPAESLQPFKVWRAPSDLRYWLNEGKLWIVQLNTEQVYVLNKTVFDFWRLLLGFGDENLIVDYLYDLYDCDKETIRKDLSEFRLEAEKHGLIERVSG